MKVLNPDSVSHLTQIHVEVTLCATNLKPHHTVLVVYKYCQNKRNLATCTYYLYCNCDFMYDRNLYSNGLLL